MPELGITYPVLVTTPKLEWVELPNPNAEAADAVRRPGAAEGMIGTGRLREQAQGAAGRQ